jgi:hypothetical protein
VNTSCERRARSGDHAPLDRTQQRFEVGIDASVTPHQIHVEVENEALPTDEPNIESLRSRIAETIEEWLEACLTRVSGQELTHAEIRARGAVVKGVLER